MRRIVMEELGHDAPLAVYQDGGDELWIVNKQYENDLQTVVQAADSLLRQLEESPQPLAPHWRLLRWLIRPICRHVHPCD